MLAVGGATVISFDGLLIRLQALTPAGILFWRGLLTGIALSGVAALVWRRSRPDQRPAWREQWWPMTQLGVFMVLGTVMFILSLTHTSVAHTFVIVAAAPLATGILGYFVLREHLPARTWLAGLAALVGVLVVVSSSLGTADLEGDLWALGNTAALACILVTLRRYPRTNQMLAIAISGFAVALVVLPWGVSFPDARSMLAAGLDGLVVVPGGMVMITLAVRHLPAAEVSLVLLLETVLAPLWVLFMIGEALTIQAVLSAVIILGAIAIHSWLDLKEQRLARSAAPEVAEAAEA
jgi:drug/metabolite transporter (DMT)-like permease